MVVAIVLGLKRCCRRPTPGYSMAQTVEDSSSGHPSVAGPQSPHLSHQPSLAGPPLPHSPQPPSLTGPLSPQPYHPSFADHQFPHSPHPSQSFGSGASSALYHSPNALQLGGNFAHPMAPSSPDFLYTAPSNGYASHASSSSPQHHSHYEAPVPVSDYTWAPGHNTGNESYDPGQGLDRHRSPQFADGQAMSPMAGAQNFPGPNQSLYPASQAGKW